MSKRPDGKKGDDRLERKLARLLTEVEALGGGSEHRREPLIERAEARGIGRAEAERAYDVAVEEGLDPAYGIALVGQGISVRTFSSDGGRSGPRATERVEPEWIDAAPSPVEAGRERRLRETFRRLRSFLEREDDARGAIQSFGREPDLDVYDY